ncbi:hypothetical protein PSACC_03629 [Paramicrosporidium saccamoebae]|uniref:Pinin/SDK/MemA protein domain-containing protein n=1 Tax=Paramicrosporidium saccamoebae TaxID=1246581 RepID=A0A2H9TFM7_9FUNG|nr:hypothetical protein PSACC_03629 [Paramicrosporidium saccamoebae]
MRPTSQVISASFTPKSNDAESTARSRRILSMLLPKLVEPTTAAQERRQAVDERLAKRMEEERLKVAEEVRIEDEQKRKKTAEERKLREEAELERLECAWTRHRELLGAHTVTKTEPPLYWSPAIPFEHSSIQQD